MKFILKVMLFSLPIYPFFYMFSIFAVYLLHHISLIRVSGDIGLNPAPKLSSFKNCSIDST